jgi:uncharacterized protein (TIGR02147 family)
MQENLSPRSFLYSELRARKGNNPAYSLRAFAQSLGLSPGRLSQYLSGKRKITSEVAKKIVNRLNLSPGQEQEWSRTKNDNALYARLNEQTFRIIADWEHYALLNLLKLRGQNHDHEKLAERLGISIRAVDIAIERLLDIGLIIRSNGRYRRKAMRLRTSDGIESRALRIAHLQDLQRAVAALEEVDVNSRDITSITMAIAKKRLPEAKVRIKAFRRELADLLEGADADEVYNFQVQLVPITKPIRPKRRI